MVGLIEGAGTLNLVNRSLLQMILQITPDTLSIQHRRNAELRQPFRGSYARPVQHLYRSDRARAQDYLALRARLHRFTSLHEPHPHGASLLEHEPIDQHIFFEPQIGPLQSRLQKAARRRPAPSALLIDMEITDALIVAGVEVR